MNLLESNLKRWRVSTGKQVGNPPMTYFEVTAEEVVQDVDLSRKEGLERGIRIIRASSSAIQEQGRQVESSNDTSASSVHGTRFTVGFVERVYIGTEHAFHRYMPYDITQVKQPSIMSWPSE
eukprot:gb/GECG01001545.1/.p1 GENE.gb/GECG01001545.1/~~gb/GECG01001545.1/.p1  ORF type:complete len:122 (+),score=9.36 gb/GECG01001545.1/:1-366(+)